MRQQVRTRLASLGLVLALGGSIPGLRTVVHRVGQISPGRLARGIALELASVPSFVTVFRLFVDRPAGRDARPLAWTGAGLRVPRLGDPYTCLRLRPRPVPPGRGPRKPASELLEQATP